MMKPRIFIGSSTEGLPVANRIKDYFETDYECKIWNDGIFQYNDNFLDTLMKSASLFDFAFMVFSADDLSKVRDSFFETPRDNVMFEYGLFLGRVGNQRAFVIKDKKVKILSDLLGITLADYETDDTGLATHSLEVTLEQLKKKIDDNVRLGQLGLLPSTVIAISYFENFIKLVADQIYPFPRDGVMNSKKYKSAKLRVVIPKDLDADMKRRATVYYVKNGLSEKVINTSHRSYPIHVQANNENEDVLLIADMPTILNGIDKAIDMYFRVGHIGKSIEQELTEHREMSNFVHVLKLLVEGDAFCKECVEIVNEDNEII